MILERPSIETVRSLFSTVDPRVKVVSTFFISLLILSQDRVVGLILFFLLSITSLLISRVRGSIVLMLIEGSALFCTLFFLTLTFTHPGERVQIGLLTISLAGMLLGLKLALKGLSIILYTCSQIFTTNFHDLIVALRLLRLPRTFVWILSLTVRYLYDLWYTLWCLLSSARLRGLNLRLNMHSLRTLGLILTVFIVRAVDRSHTLSQVLNLRVQDALPDIIHYQESYKIAHPVYVLLLTAYLLIFTLSTCGVIP